MTIPICSASCVCEGQVRVGVELDDRERDPLALDAARADVLAPERDDGLIGDVAQVRHG
jgi:hypothetical protein